jgi:hypothetical protein
MDDSKTCRSFEATIVDAREDTVALEVCIARADEPEITLLEYLEGRSATGAEPRSPE